MEEPRRSQLMSQSFSDDDNSKTAKQDDVRNHPERWCLSFDQLLELEETAKSHFGHRYERQTMRDICREIVIPRCNETGQSYALSLNATGLEIGGFVTHCWDGVFAEFVHSLKSAFQAKSRKPNLWICAFSLLQSNDAEVIASQIHTSSLEETAFARAIAKAPLFVCIRNSHCDLYSRIWCVCELFFAKEYGLFPEYTFVSGPDTFKHVASSCVDAVATKSEDKLWILRALLQREGDAERVDEIIREFRSHCTPYDDNLARLPTVPHRSQIEIKQHYTPILKKRGKVYRKKATAFIRKAIQGEFITTTIGGIKETDNRVQDDSSWVVCGIAGEHYVLTQAQFEENYDVANPREIRAGAIISAKYARRLRKEGYREYQSRRRVWGYEAQYSDLPWFMPRKNQDFAFGEAPWGSLMRIEPGDFLVTQYPLASDGVYRVEGGVFEDTYEQDDDANDGSERQWWQEPTTVLGASLAVAVIAVAANYWRLSGQRLPRR